jgi:DNA repair exonuclease SbcCD ATPase subunit
MPSLLGEVNLQQIRYTAAEDLLVVGSTVIHRSANGLFCLNDLHSAICSGEENKNPNRFLRLKSTAELIKRLEAIYGPGILETVLYGDNRGSYAHEELAQDYAGWLNPIYKDQLRAVARQASILQVKAAQAKLKEVEERLGKEYSDRIETQEQLSAYVEENEILRQGIQNLHDDYESQKKNLEMSKLAKGDKRFGALSERLEALQNRCRQQDETLETANANMEVARECFAKLVRNAAVKANNSTMSICNDGLRALDRALGY